VLNIVFLLLAAALLVRFFRSGGGPMLRMMNGAPGEHGEGRTTSTGRGRGTARATASVTAAVTRIHGSTTQEGEHSRDSPRWANPEPGAGQKSASQRRVTSPCAAWNARTVGSPARALPVRESRRASDG
jgi:hypothetical protein